VTLDGPATDQITARVGDRLASDAAVESTRGGLRIRDVRPEAIGDAVDALDAAGVAFESLAWAEPSLEDVYLRLTGEEYSPREGEIAPASHGIDETDAASPDGGER